MASMNIAVIGASGGIGSEFVRFFLRQDEDNRIHAFSRSPVRWDNSRVYSGNIDYNDEASIQLAAQDACLEAPLDLVIVATGLLHDVNMQPEKSLSELSADKFEKSFLINSVGPALVAKHFLPKLRKDRRSVFAVLSARVGSISDNRLGGWYAYRASKAALNMLVKTASLELKRKNKAAVIVALHPGTVATHLSEPFQKRVPKEKLFTTSYSTQMLVHVLEKLEAADSGKIFAWDGQEIPA